MSVRVMSAVWDLPLPPSEKLVLLALADWASDDGRCWPSIKAVADKSGVSQRTVQRMLREAENNGLIERREIIGKGCEYRLTPRHSVTPDKVAPVTNATETPDTVSPNTSGTTIKGEAIASPKAWARPNGVDSQIWKDLLGNRKRKGQGNSLTAWKRFLSDLARVSASSGIPPNDLIEHAAAKGWGGIYDPTPREQANGQSPYSALGKSTQAFAMFDHADDRPLGS